MTNIGIVGSGGMGRGIARRFAAAGAQVTITDHKPDSAQRVAADAGAGQPGSVVAGDLSDVLDRDLIVLALWYPGTTDFAARHSAALAGKTVIDIANPLDSTYTRLSLPPTTSAAEELAGTIPRSTIVKAFNTVPSTTLFDAAVDGTPLDTFVASDDEAARAAVISALARSGLRALDAGALDNARLLERLCAFGIELGQLHGVGFGFGIKFLPTALPETGA